MNIYGKEVVYDCTSNEIIFAGEHTLPMGYRYFEVVIIGSSDFAKRVDKHYLYEYEDTVKNEFYSFYFSFEDITAQHGLSNLLDNLAKAHGFKNIGQLKLFSKKFCVSSGTLFSLMSHDLYEFFLTEEAKCFGNTYDVLLELYNIKNFGTPKNEKLYEDIQEYGILEYTNEVFDSLDLASIIDSMFKRFTYNKTDIKQPMYQTFADDVFSISKSDIKNLLLSIIKERYITREIESEIHSIGAKICLNPALSQDRKIIMLYTFADVLSQNFKGII